MSTTEATPADIESQPHLDPTAREIQTFDQRRKMPIGLDADLRAEIAAGLNVILADTRIL